MYVVTFTAHQQRKIVRTSKLSWAGVGVWCDNKLLTDTYGYIIQYNCGGWEFDALFPNLYTVYTVSRPLPAVAWTQASSWIGPCLSSISVDLIASTAQYFRCNPPVSMQQSIDWWRDSGDIESWLSSAYTSELQHRVMWQWKTVWDV